MGRQYNHLKYEERMLVGHLSKEGHTLRDVSRRLGRAASTISRELKRNSNAENKYLFHAAEYLSRQRRKHSYRKPRLKTKFLQSHVREKLKDGWSPEQIAGRRRVLNRSPFISHEAIYQFIYEVEPELSQHLVRHHAKRKRLGQSKKKNKTSIPQRTPISERSEHILTRSEIGHWECDLMICSQNASSVQVAVERKTRLVQLRHLKTRTAAENANELILSLQVIPKRLCRTLTYDNGSENAHHRQVNAVLGTKSYFCDQYKSWQKGTVENTIGRLRRQIKGRTNLADLSLEALKRLETQMNDTFTYLCSPNLTQLPALSNEF